MNFKDEVLVNKYDLERKLKRYKDLHRAAWDYINFRGSVSLYDGDWKKVKKALFKALENSDNHDDIKD